MDIEFELHAAPLKSGLVDELTELAAIVFGQSDRNYTRWRVSQMPDVSALRARSKEQLVGFKVGYAVAEHRYYSWLGGVHPDFRRRRIASELMERHHRWLTQRGYRVVETATNPENHAMVQANLRHGFSVCGYRADPERTQILFSKSLRSTMHAGTGEPGRA